MKTFNKIFSLIAAATLFAAGCVNEDPAYLNEKPVEPADQQGYLSVSGMSMRVILDGQTETNPDDTEGETGRPSKTKEQPAEATDSYIVQIFDAANTLVLDTNYGALKIQLAENPLPLEVGNYRMEIRSETEAPATAWEKPVYGASKEFSIRKAQTTEIGQVVCTLSNIKVTLMCAADLASQLTDDTTSSISLGDNTVTFVKGEKKAAYFMPLAATNTLRFQLTGKFADTQQEASFTKTISNVKAGQWRKITLVIAYADKGDIKFDIKVESFIQDEEVIINGTEGLWEQIYEPEIDPTAPTIVWADHDITKPFQLKATMFDADNKCTEPFRFDLTSPNGVTKFLIDLSSTNNEFMQSLQDLNIPTQFDLCEVTPAHPAYTILAAFGFPLGDEVKGAKAKSFDIGGAMPLLYNRPGFDGTHTFAFTLTDANSLSSSATLSLIVDRSNEDNAPTIVWRGYDIDKQYPLDPAMQLDIDFTAAAGIRSLVVTILSDTLTPEELASVGLPHTFDLCNITDPDLAKTLGTPAPDGFGFPINEKVKDKTNVPFSITTFVPMLQMFSGAHNFQLALTDNKGVTTTKTVQLFVTK